MPRRFAFVALLIIAAAPAGNWAFPGFGVTSDPSASHAADAVRLAGSPLVYHQADFDSMARAIDWFPSSHPKAPGIVVREGGEGAYPCGYCHLPDGRGRPENARLQGLPADYIIEQVKAFASGARRAASADFAPSRYMASVAHAISAADLEAAAVYFSRFEPQSHTQIIEAATIPAAAAWHFVYRFDDARREALGERIVEGPVDRRRYELRDPETAYVAYVPLGAIGRGRGIAEHGIAGGPACVSCHGAALKGIAGASPSYLARQLMGFRDRTRNDPDAVAMQAVAGRLSDAAIIDVAAFVGNRPAWRRGDVP